ncbi:MFS transporter [Crenobacter sp. SG2305]|uniref:MFS transporter n=1 Tax=Crenobacter oryzisoli TaxID=3056844 RepID=UPI0025AACB4C|nr:MFS transporter [Crenobacter sp. SG2305]MDN0085110.1 MFS transporter [Crenobacter sp. SG2305]
MNSLELRASLGLAGVYALRMLGMFLILPVFALYAKTLPGVHSYTAIGMAFGAYGVAQTLFQLPLGILSDRIGRKKVIYGGLLVLAAGSFLAAWAPTLAWLIVARAIQGAGAVSAAVMALLADLTKEENRTKAMAMIGISIGTTFAVSLVLGPLLGHWIGVNGIFALTGALTLAAILGVKFLVPNPTISRFHSDAEAKAANLPTVLKNGQLLRLNFGIFVLHAAQMAMFVVMPFALIKIGGLDKAHHWQVYLPVAVTGFILMVPPIIYGEKRHQLKRVFVLSISLMALAHFGMAFALSSLWMIVLWLTFYFIAFNTLEATLPSLVSKIAPAGAKGTAIGVYNMSQSFGLALGPMLGGWLYTHYGSIGVFSFSGALMLVWLVIAMTMRPPLPVKTAMFHIGDSWKGNAATLSDRLAQVRGVREAVVMADERVAYLKVMQQDWDEPAVQQLIQETY